MKTRWCIPVHTRKFSLRVPDSDYASLTSPTIRFKSPSDSCLRTFACDGSIVLGQRYGNPGHATRSLIVLIILCLIVQQCVHAYLSTHADVERKIQSVFTVSSLHAPLSPSFEWKQKTQYYQKSKKTSANEERCCGLDIGVTPDQDAADTSYAI